MKKLIATLIVIPILIVSCTNAASNTLTIFHAGSLSIPLKVASDSFKTQFPNTIFKMESAGSIDCARKITELGRSCDILASADYSVIDKLLIPEYASTNIPFAGNEMAIVYSAKSKYKEIINKNNWPEILMKEDVIYGRSDPNSDPCGYRTIMTLQLAESYYQMPYKVSDFTSKNTNYIRPKEIDLLSLLESNSIDYIFIYKSVAIQHSLNYIELPREINLSDQSLSDQYKKAQVEIRGKKPGETLIMDGSPMVYSMTIPKNAPNPKLAQEFVNFLLSEKGQQIMESMGQNKITSN
jgi:molybdate/tungstate transport system substrate-binding protein